MWTMLGRSLGLVLLIATLVVAAPLDQVSRSAAIAAELGKALSEQGLDAIAAQDPDEQDRFIAALFFKDTQLLVVSARFASPSLLKARLAQKQYRDVYLDLSGSAIPDTSILFQDMNADGLCTRRDQAADIVYDEGQTAKIFDGDWGKDESAKTYEQEFAAADQRYSRLLSILLAQLRAGSDDLHSLGLASRCCAPAAAGAAGGGLRSRRAIVLIGNGISIPS